MDFEVDVQIDKHSLDEECTRQPQLYHKWASEHARTVDRVANLKDSLKVLVAEISLDIRKNPDEYGLGKLTESAIQEIITVRKEVIELRREILELESEANILEVAKFAFVDRKNQLQNLVSLFCAGYWSDIKLPADTREKVGKQTEVGTKTQVENLNKNKKPKKK